MTSAYWEHLATTDFKNYDPDKTVVVMPVGSVEQHGPHLPVCVDARIAQGIVAEMLRQVPQDLCILVLPLLPVGKANEHIGFDGTLSLSVNTLTDLWTDIAESVFRTGLKKLMIMNSHGGQTQVAGIVARDLRVRHNALVVPVNWWDLRAAPDLYDADEYRYGIHGGAEETSVMLHLAPDLVRRDACARFTSVAAENRDAFPLLYGQGVRHSWTAADLNPAGALGDATKASATDGAEIVKAAAASLVALAAEMAAFPLGRLAATGAEDILT